MFVIGTAGHVDHGKSTLVQALTGIDPDRLAEEKAREMTIDLGFAWLRLEGISDEVGVVDVPGHRDFIENMLAGVGGIDLALFVVAADEGVMPQTQEHLAILDLLDVKSGIVAVTKADLIDDPEWLELVILDISEALEGTVLEDAPMIPVSSHTGQGIDDLKQTLIDKLLRTAEKADTGRPRLPIDRVFSLSGFGTIVTGTLIDGQLRVGDEIELQPSGRSGRIRGLQTHKTKLQVARPGSRVAVNLSGIDKQDVPRGDVLTRPDIVRPSTLLDAHYRHLEGAGLPLKHNAEVKLFIGSAEKIARVRLIGTEQIEAGDSGFIQLSLRENIATVRGDRFILRRPSPAATIGGGRILDAQPGRQHRRFRADVLQRLKTLSKGTPDELVLQALTRSEPVAPTNLQKAVGLDSAEFQSILTQLQAEGQIVQLGKQLVTISTVNEWSLRIEQWLHEFHRAQPLRLGMSREEIRSRLRLKAVVFNPIIGRMVAQNLITEADALLHTSDHQVAFSPQQQATIDRLMRQFAKSGINTPSVKECQAMIGSDVYQALLDLNQIVQVSKDVVWRKPDYETFVQTISDHLCKHETMTVGDVRDTFSTSRKYAIGLLEHLDKLQITRRIGDARELVRRNRC